MPTAYCLIRDQPVYRRDAFVGGLKEAGYEVEFGYRTFAPGDVLIIWNRYGDYDRRAKEFERAGNRVLVAENGYLGREWRDDIWYAISPNRHNVGAPYGGPGRWDGWKVGLKPWRKGGDHILVLPQRGIGVAPVRQPDFWLERVLDCLNRQTRPVKVRRHPGTADPRPVDVGLLKDLENAHCVVTWASGAALKALAEGIPVFHGFPDWIGASASLPFGGDLERPFLGERIPMFRRMAWGMWNLKEIRSGEPFKWMLRSTESTTTPARVSLAMQLARG